MNRICSICKKPRVLCIKIEQDEENGELIMLASEQLAYSDEFCRGHDTVRQEVPQAFYDAFNEEQA